MLYLEEMITSYIGTALWSTWCNGAVDHDGCHGGDCDSSLEYLSYDADDLSAELLAAVQEDCVNFLTLLDGEGVDHAVVPAERMGHDLWLTRNRHGAGFWARGYGELGDVLTKWAHSMGEESWTVNGDEVERE